MNSTEVAAGVFIFGFLLLAAMGGLFIYAMVRFIRWARRS